MNDLPPINDICFPTPCCLICDSAGRVRRYPGYTFEWVCDDCVPHVHSAQLLCAVMDQIFRPILGDQPE